MHVDPQRDGDGHVLRHNYPDILDRHHVIRRITPHDLCTDQTSGLRRVASGAYSESSDPPGGMSVNIEEWMIADCLDPLHYLEDQSHGATRINVGDLRAQGFQVGWDPQPNNPHHGEVWGIGNGSTRRKKVAALAVTIRPAEGEGEVDPQFSPAG